MEGVLLKVKHPGEFWVRFKETEDGRSTKILLTELEQQLNDFALTTSGLEPQGRPCQGDLVLVKAKDDKQWYRGQVLSLLRAPNKSDRRSYVASVFYLDYAGTASVPVDCLLQAPSFFEDLPFQACRCRLYQLEAVSLRRRTDLSCVSTRSDDWDESGVMFFNDLLTGKRLQVNINQQDGNGTFHVTLYAGDVCVNKALVDEAYAQPFTEKEEQDAVSRHTASSKSVFNDNSTTGDLDHADKRDAGRSEAAQVTHCVTTATSQGPRGDQPITDRLLRRLARQLKDSWVDIAYEIELEQSKIDELRSIRKAVDACFAVLDHWRNLGASAQLMVESLYNADMIKEASAAKKVLFEGDSPTSEQAGRPGFRASLSPALASPTQERGSSKWSPSLANSSPSWTPKVGNSTSNDSSPVTASTPFSSTPKQQSSAVADLPRRPSFPSFSQEGSSSANSPSASVASSSVLRVKSLSPVVQPSGMPQSGGKILANENTPVSRSVTHSDSDQMADTQCVSSDSDSKPRLPWGVKHSFVSSDWKRPAFDLHSCGNDLPGLPIGNQKAGLSKGERQQALKVSQEVGGFAVVSGSGCPHPIVSIEKSHAFPERLVQICSEAFLTKARAIQAYAWPAIMRGLHVVGVASSGAGKTLSYVVPLLGQVMQPTLHRDVPKGIGPLVLVILPFWKKVHDCHALFYHLAVSTRSSKCRCCAVHGAGAEEEEVTNLINGCEILVATPACLIRLLNKGQTSLSRIRYVVMDDADTLTELFPLEIREIMTQLDSSMKKSKNRPPPQMLTFTSTWTPAVAALVEAYLDDEVAVVSNKLEMAIYMKCHMLAHMCKVEHLQSKLRLLLDTCMQEQQQGQRIVVCTSDGDAAEQIKEILVRYSFPVICLHENMLLEQVLQNSKKWNSSFKANSVPVLIVSDGVLQKLTVTNARHLIHFDIPPKKSALIDRFECLRDAFECGEGSMCTTHFMVTDEDKFPVNIVIHLLRRFNADIPQELLKRSEKAVQAREGHSAARTPFCRNIRQWGECHHFIKGKTTCQMRHVVLGEVDRPDGGANHTLVLPTSGYARVVVTHVVSAGHYWVRLMEHRQPSSSTSSNAFNRQFLQLVMDMMLHFGSPENCQPAATLDIGKYYACRADVDNSYHRVVLLKKFKSKHSATAEVEFVDIGCRKSVSWDQLCVLPKALAAVSRQALEVFVCNVRPKDRDLEWTPQANQLMQVLLKDRQLEGKIVASMAGNLWLDPLVERRMMDEIKVLSVVFNVKQQLLQKDLADVNPSHLKKLGKYFHSWMPAEEVVQQEQIPIIKLEGMNFLNQEFLEVYVSSVNTPASFYVQLASTVDRLEEIQGYVNDVADSCLYSESDGPHIGSVCLGLQLDDDVWYRAQVMRRRKDELKLFYVDFGNTEWVETERVKPLPREPLLEEPMLAIHCCLSGVQPFDDQWTEKDGKALYDICRGKLLMLKVCHFAPASDGLACHTVELFDSSGADDVLIAEELCNVDHALRTGSAGVKIPENVAVKEFIAQMGDEATGKLPELCRILMRTKDKTDCLSLVEAIRDVITNCSQHVSLLHNNGLTPLCRALCSLKSEDLQDHLVVAMSTLLSAAVGQDLENHLHNGVQALCDTLGKASSPALIERICWAFKNLIDVDTEAKDVIREEGGVRYLCRLLSSISEAKALESIVWTLISVGTGNQRNIETIRNEGGILAACRWLAKQESSQVAIQLTRWLQMAATGNEKVRHGIRIYGGVPALCQLASASHLDQDILQVVHTLQVVLDGSEESFNVAAKSGVTSCLNKLLSQRCSMVTRGVCDSILQRLQAAQSGISNSKNGDSDFDDGPPPLEGDDDIELCFDGLPSVHPMVAWSQTRQDLRLLIHLSDVVHRQLTVDQYGFSFKTLVQEQLYSLELDFFAPVLPDDYREKITGAEVRFVFPKKEICMWPRLLKDKRKAPFITADFDSVVDSDDEADTEWNWPETEDGANKGKKARPRHHIPEDLVLNWQRQCSSDDVSMDSDLFEALD